MNKTPPVICLNYIIQQFLTQDMKIMYHKMVAIIVGEDIHSSNAKEYFILGTYQAVG